MSYCLLHTAAITCATFCGTGTGQEAVLVSGALDGQIIAWDHTTGADLSVMLPSTCAKCEESDNATGELGHWDCTLQGIHDCALQQ